MESIDTPKFVLKDDRGRKYHNLPGTKVVSIKDQVLISSGVLSLDSLIGGGLPLGSIFLIEEDEFGVFSKYLAKYFLAEGIACKHCLYIASIDCDTRQLVKDLPSPVEFSVSSRSSDQNADDLKIAWRYRDTPMVQSSPSLSGAPVFGHNFDLTSPYSKEVLDNAEITHWPYDTNCENPYSALLSDLYSHIQKQGHSVKLAQPRRTVLRIVLHSLGSPLWPQPDYLPRFLLSLRHMLQAAFACVLITLSTDMVETTFRWILDDSTDLPQMKLLECLIQKKVNLHTIVM
ncbi:elongator complex protein 4-like [Macrosteles quadrilineatus]|uniref:elongator complex protein 4-like n=1 Tax=Macrosteles quadrilineatus TaxID=74068 RepID=UPI0023E1B2F3|nr:elongator complex protein 4-like [Macrosteles quadrilineatus]